MRTLRPYRLPFALALPAGALLGALLGLAIFPGTSADTRTWGWLLFLLAFGAGAGAVLAVAAAAGSAAALLLYAKRGGQRPRPAVGILGAGCGVSVAVAVLGLCLTIGSSSWAGYPLWILAALGLGLTTSAVAALLTAWSGRVELLRARS